MYAIDTFESKHCYSKEECLKQLANYLNTMYNATRIIDIEKEWILDKNRVDYNPSLKLKAIILIQAPKDAE